MVDYTGKDATMIRLILLALAVSLTCATSAFADDYLVRVEKSGYVKQPIAGAEPKEKVLQTVEVIARPDSKFHAKVVIGMQTVILAGKFRFDEKGDIVIDIQYDDIVDTGETIPLGKGRYDPVLDETKIKTTVSGTEGKPITLGGIIAVRNESDNPQAKSKSRYLLVVTKYRPAAD